MMVWPEGVRRAAACLASDAAFVVIMLPVAFDPPAVLDVLIIDAARLPPLLITHPDYWPILIGRFEEC